MYSSIDAVLYDKAITSLIRYPIGKAGIINIPDTVTAIEDEAFRNCGELESVTIGKRVETIGVFSFRDCSKLTSVIIPDAVTRVKHGAFNSCSGVTSIIIGNGVETIGTNAFENCSRLSSVIIPDSVISIDDFAFNYCSSLAIVSIGNKVETIGRFAFNNCDELVMVTFNCNISQNGFDYSAFYHADLRQKYFANSGGPGTYVKDNRSDRWSKQ
jgi:hypothetical protein